MANFIPPANGVCLGSYFKSKKMSLTDKNNSGNPNLQIYLKLLLSFVDEGSIFLWSVFQSSLHITLFCQFVRDRQPEKLFDTICVGVWIFVSVKFATSLLALLAEGLLSSYLTFVFLNQNCFYFCML